MIFKWLACFVLILNDARYSSCTGGGDTSTSKGYEKTFNRGRSKPSEQVAVELFEQGNFAEAKEIYDKLIKIDPLEKGRYFLMRGKCRIEVGENDEALKDFQEASKSRFLDSSERELLARSLARLQKFDEAEKELIRVLKELPFGDQLKLADEWCTKEFSKIALAMYAFLLEIDSEPNELTAISLIARGYCNMKMGDQNAAISDFEKAQKIRKRRSPDYIDNLGEILYIVGLFVSGKSDEAKEKFLALEDTEQIRIFLWELLTQKKLDEIFLSCLDEKIKTCPDNGDYFWLRGHYLAQKGDIENALIYFRKGIEKNPSKKLYRVLLACRLRELGRLDEARKVLEDLDVDLGHESSRRMVCVNCWIKLGEEFLSKGRKSEAKEILQAVDNALARATPDDRYVNVVPYLIEALRRKIETGIPSHYTS